MRIILLALAVFLLSPLALAGKTFQTELKTGVWQMVGVNGYHHVDGLALKSGPGPTYYTLTDTDDSDGNVTYDTTLSGASNNNSDEGNRTYSTVGVQVIPGNDYGLATTSFNYKKRAKNSALSFRTMYVAMETGSRPLVRIIYQSNYEGDPFYITFDGGLEYLGTFNLEKSYDNPGVFGVAVDVDTNEAVNKIDEIIDMNLSDNNLSNLENFDVDKSSLFAAGYNGAVAGGRQTLSGYDANLTVYRWDSENQKWLIYRSGNSVNQNELTTVTAGQSYWVKVSTSRDTVPGLILGTGHIDDNTTYSSTGLLQEDTGSYLTYRKWNMLSYNDTCLRYTISGMFIHSDFYRNGSFLIRGPYKDDYITILSNVTDSDLETAAYINNALAVMEANGSISWNMRAYPAASADGNGIVVISDQLFEVNATADSEGNLTTLAGFSPSHSYELNVTGVGRDGDYHLVESPLDEYVLAMEFNKDLLLDVGPTYRQGRLYFTAPLYNTAKYDINLSQAGSELSLLNGVTSELPSIAGAFLIDRNLDDANDTILIGATTPFYLQDATYSRIYDYDPTGVATTVTLEGDAGDTTVTTGSTLTQMITNINALEGTTGISAFEINGSASRILLVTDSHRTFALREGGDQDQFYEVFDEGNETAMGAVKQIFGGLSLTDVPLREWNVSAMGTNWTLDRTALLSSDNNVGIPYNLKSKNDDLGYSPYWSEAFPVSNVLTTLRGVESSDFTAGRVRPEAIITGITRSDNTILWRQADLTMDPVNWKNDQFRFNLFNIEKERGYWTYLTSGGKNPLSISGTSFYGDIRYHFVNRFDINESNRTGEVLNYFNQVLDVTIKGLVDSTAIEENESYNVQLYIDGQVYGLTRNGTTDRFTITLNNRDIPQLEVVEEPASQVSLDLVVTDGQGYKITENIPLDIVRPTPPVYSFREETSSLRGAMNVNCEYTSSIKILEGNVSDTEGDWNELVTTTEHDCSSNLVFIPVDFDEIIYGTPDKPYYDLRLISVDDSDLYSDMRRVFYAPVYRSTHLLETNASITTDAEPVYCENNGSNCQHWTDNGGSYTDSGIQLDAMDENVSSLSYLPKMGTKLNTNLVYTMDLNTSDGNLTGRVKFMPSYAGEVFYYYHSGVDQLFYGVFPNGDRTGGSYYVPSPIENNQTFAKPVI